MKARNAPADPLEGPFWCRRVLLSLEAMAVETAVKAVKAVMNVIGQGRRSAEETAYQQHNVRLSPLLWAFGRLAQRQHRLEMPTRSLGTTTRPITRRK